MLGGRHTRRLSALVTGTILIGGIVGTAAPASAILIQHSLTGTGSTQNGNVCEAFSGEVARFSDTFPVDVAQYSAAVNWGDGSAASTGTISQLAFGTFSVTGTHVYSQHGRFNVVTAVAGPNESTATLTGASNVAGQPLKSLGGRSVPSQVEGRHLNAILANFSDVVCAQQSDEQATIDWGDGSAVTAGVPANFVVTTPSSSASRDEDDDDAPPPPPPPPPLPRLAFDVSGGHTYERDGTYTVAVTVTNVRGERAIANTTLRILDASIHAEPGDSLDNGAEPGFLTGGTPTTGELSRFTSDNPFALRSDFIASVDWGDGVVTGGSITGPSGPTAGPWLVSGSHQYAEDGTFVVTVTITSSGGSSVVVIDSARVAEPSNPIDLVLDKVLF